MDLNRMEDIEKLDESNILEDLEGFPSQIREAIEIGKQVNLPFSLENYDRVATVGMGGSAIIGDLLSQCINMPVVTYRDYFLGSGVGETDLLLAVSYSGNTEETLSALEDGCRRGMDSLCISTGGKMESFCRDRKIPFVKIPTGLQPRASTGYMLFPLLQIFSEAGLTGTFDPVSVCSQLDELSESWGRKVSLEENFAKSMAKKLAGKIPVFYSSSSTKVIAYRWKTQFNENAKQPAFWNVFPELNHNETVGYRLVDELDANLIPIMIETGLEYERNKLRMDIMGEILEEEGIDYEIIPPREGDRFDNLFGQIYLGDFVSVYLALINGVDPSPVELIENFKAKMKKAQP